MNQPAQSRDKTFPTASTGPDKSSAPSDTVNPIHRMQKHLEGIYKRRHLENIEDKTPASACLKPLLLALDWTGSPRHLTEALPHLEPVSDIDDIRALLSRLNYDTKRKSLRLNEIRPGMMPCLFVPESGGNILVLMRIEDDGKLLVFDGKLGNFLVDAPDKSRGDAYFICPLDREAIDETVRKYGWINTILGRFKMVFAKLMLQTFAINILALSLPIYIMSVYDKAIGAKSPVTLFYFLAGLLILLGVEMLLRAIRGRTVAFLGARFESVVTISAFQHLLHLPVAMTQSASISAQITRLKQFGNIRDLFVGQLGNAILDVPFAIVFVAAIFAIGGSLGYLPLGLLALFIVATVLTIPLARTRVRRAGESKTATREFLMELTERYKSVSDSGAEDIWADRFKTICSRHLLQQFHAQQFNMTLQSVSQLMVMITGVLTITLGAVQAIEGHLSAGALIAVVALIWRLLSPIQAVFLSLNRIGQMLDTFKQIDNMMRLPTERLPGSVPTFERKFKGNISLVGIGFRYNAQSEPAIRGISLDIEPGQIVAITGPSSAGKTTLLKLVAGLYQPQAGVVRVDGLDLRQIDSAQYRHDVGYVTETNDFFYGTVAQNLKLADPLVSRDEMLEALRKAGLSDLDDVLTEGLDTRIKTSDRHAIPNGVLQQLSLARAYVKNPDIYLLDDPGSRLDNAGDKAFIEQLRALSGKATVLLVTHRPSHMRCADRVIVMNQGLVAGDGSPEEIVPAIMNSGQKAQN